MSNIKKIFLFLFIIFCFLIQSAFAVDINVRPNNTISNSEVTNNSNQNNRTNNSNTNIIYSNETATNNTSSAPAVSTSTTSSRSQNNKLTISDIIDIIVASIGIVNLLLGIAILIRFK